MLRWNHPVCGQLLPLGRWAMDAACAEAARWDAPVRLSVNLLPLQFRQPDLARQVADALARTRLPGERLDLEVTEGLLLGDTAAVLRTVQALKKQGVRLTLDGSGTAYASLSTLRRFPFDRIKIDKSFVRGMCDDSSALAIVEAILMLGARLNLAVVAEGVETEQQFDALRRLGCALVQGFLTGPPMTADRARLAVLRQPVRRTR